MCGQLAVFLQNFLGARLYSKDESRSPSYFYEINTDIFSRRLGDQINVIIRHIGQPSEDALARIESTCVRHLLHYSALICTFS